MITKQASFQRCLCRLFIWCFLSFFPLPSPFFSMPSHSRYLDVTLWLFGVDDHDGYVRSWAGLYQLREKCIVMLELAARSLASPSFPPPVHCLNPTEMTPQLPRLLTKTLMDWQFESQLLSWCSFNYKAWEFSWPVSAPVGSSSWRWMLEFKIDLSVQTDTWWITRCSWSHLM